jgi:hypothetical protein
VGTQATVDLYFLLEARTTGRVDLHHQFRIVGMIDHRGIVPCAKQSPRSRELADLHWVVRIDTLDPESGE